MASGAQDQRHRNFEGGPNLALDHNFPCEGRHLAARVETNVLRGELLRRGGPSEEPYPG